MHKKAYYIINAITFYRLLSVPVLIILLSKDRIDIFRWMLAFSFFTDSIDGWLARKYKTSSVFGARLDSISDDLTVVTGIIGIIVCDPLFFAVHSVIVAILALLFATQITASLVKYRKPTSFHTYSAKMAAVAQGVFIILFFFIPDMPVLLFYIAAALTIANLVEEIILVVLLPQWRADVKGLFWLGKSGL